MKKQLLTAISTVLLASTALAACAPSLPAGFQRTPVNSSAISAQTSGRTTASSMSVAKQQMAARQAKTPVVRGSQPGAAAPVLRNTARFDTPQWVRDAVFYQIFPERFFNGNPKNDPQGTEPWGSKPTITNYMGGDLDGVIQKLPYLKELGINAIYFNPVFEAPTSNHKYNTADYMKLDKSFGDMGTFKRLIDAAHAQGIKVVLDAVFNHSGETHWAFQDAIKNGPKSKYWNWYLIHGFPVVMDPKPNYEAWWGFSTLPKFNEYNPEVRKYLYEVAEFWTKQGIDGWRLDVPNEVRDMQVWRDFRKVVKGINPNIYIVGEIWGDGSPWLQGDQFDAVMNYQFRDQVFNFFVNNKANVDEIDWGLESLRNRHPEGVTYTMFNVLGSHDTARMVTMANKDMNLVRLMALFQMTYVGAPVIYYGDEIGMEGEMDPDCRRAMPWNPAQWNQELRTYYKRLIQIRNQYPALRRGSFRSLMRHNDNRTFAYLREDAQSKIMVVMNNNTVVQDVPIDTARVNVPDGNLKDLITGKTYPIRNGQVSFPQMAPKSGLVLEWTR